MGSATSGDLTQFKKDVMAHNMKLYDAEVYTFLTDPNISNADKVKTIMPLAVKHIKTDIGLNVSGDIILNIIRNADGNTRDVIDHQVIESADASV